MKNVFHQKNLEDLRELAGKIADGHAEGQDSEVLANELLDFLNSKNKSVDTRLVDKSLQRSRSRLARVNMVNGSIEISVQGYGDKTSTDGHGIPILIEQWKGELRAVLWTDINVEDPEILCLEGARESRRNE